MMKIFKEVNHVMLCVQFFFFTRWEHIRKHLPSLQPCKMKLIKDMRVGEVKNELLRKLSGNNTNYFLIYAHLTK